MAFILVLIMSLLSPPSFAFNSDVDTAYPFHNYSVAWEWDGAGSIIGASSVRSMDTVDIRRPGASCALGNEEPVFFPLWVGLEGPEHSWIEIGTWDGCDGRRYWYTYASWDGHQQFLGYVQIFGKTTHKFTIWRNPVSPTEWVMSVDNVNLASYWTPYPVMGKNASAGIESYSPGAIVYGPGSQVRQLRIEYTDGVSSWWQPWSGQDFAFTQPGMQGDWQGNDGVDVCENSGLCPYTA